MAFTDEQLALVSQYSPSYKASLASESKAVYERQMALNQAQARAQHMKDNKGDFLGNKPKLGLPSVGKPSSLVEGTLAYGAGVDPRQTQLMERNFALNTSGMPLLEERGASQESAMQGDIMRGVNSMDMAKYDRSNPKPSQPTTAIKEYRLAKNQGFTGSFMDYQNQGGGGVDPTSNMRDMEYYMQMPDGTEQEQINKALFKNAISKGSIVDQGTFFVDTNSGQKYDKNIINEGAQTGEIANINQRLDDYPSTAVQAGSFISDLDTTIDDLDQLLAYTSDNNVGWEGYLSVLPETGANKWMNMRDTITSRFALDKMMELKNASPTGSTGFGALNEKEMLVMQQYMGSLEQAQSAPELKRIITKITKLLKDKRKLASRGLQEADKWYDLNASRYRPNSTMPRQEYPEDAAPVDNNSVNWGDM